MAKIGGFVYDTLAQEMIDFAKAKLGEAGVAPDSFRHLHSPMDKGSWLLLTFSSPELLQDARMAFRSHAFECNGRKIWLDAAKTKAELRPARLIHRAFTAVTEEEATQPVKMEVEKNMKGKQLKVGRDIAAFTLNGQLKWTSFAKNRYGSEKCEILRAWVESE